MSMSLDGFVAGPNEGPGNGLGDGGHRSHEWCLTGNPDDPEGVPNRLAGVNGKVIDEFIPSPWSKVFAALWIVAFAAGLTALALHWTN